MQRRCCSDLKLDSTKHGLPRYSGKQTRHMQLVQGGDTCDADAISGTDAHR